SSGPVRLPGPEAARGLVDEPRVARHPAEPARGGPRVDVLVEREAFGDRARAFEGLRDRRSLDLSSGTRGEARRAGALEDGRPAPVGRVEDFAADRRLER